MWCVESQPSFPGPAAACSPEPSQALWSPSLGRQGGGCPPSPGALPGTGDWRLAASVSLDQLSLPVPVGNAPSHSRICFLGPSFDICLRDTQWPWDRPQEPLVLLNMIEDLPGLDC